MPKNKFDISLLSPKPSTIKEQYSSAKRETTAEKIPIAAIVIPLARKNCSSRKQELSSSKTQAQLPSGQKKPFESMSIETKKALQSGNKPNGAISQRNMISIQKSEDGSAKLFADRKASEQPDSISLRTS